VFFAELLSFDSASSEFESCLEISASDFLCAEAKMDSRWELCSEALADSFRDAPGLGAKIDPLLDFFEAKFSDSACGSGAGPCWDSTIDFSPFLSEVEPWIDLRLGSLESCG
jgi:hypothetical protein